MRTAAPPPAVEKPSPLPHCKNVPELISMKMYAGKTQSQCDNVFER